MSLSAKYIASKISVYFWGTCADLEHVSKAIQLLMVTESVKLLKCNSLTRVQQQ
jgi:hypothetical protein